VDFKSNTISQIRKVRFASTYIL